MVIGLMGQRTDGSAGHRARERCANAEIPELLFRKCMVFSIDFLYIRTDHQYFSSYCKSAPAKSHPRAEPMGQWVSGLMGHKGFTRLMSHQAVRSREFFFEFHFESLIRPNKIDSVDSVAWPKTIC